MLVLIVDHVTTARLSLDHFLTPRGFRVIHAKSAHEALKQIKSQPRIKVVISKFELRGIAGTELLEDAKRLERYDDDGRVPPPKFVFITDMEEKMQKVKHLDFTMLMQPIDKEHLLNYLTRIDQETSQTSTYGLDDETESETGSENRVTRLDQRHEEIKGELERLDKQHSALESRVERIEERTKKDQRKS